MSCGVQHVAQNNYYKNRQNNFINNVNFKADSLETFQLSKVLPITFIKKTI